MDSMDFGLARFLEMFEARFGRVAGTVLLAMIGLALATFTGRLILSGLILPIYEAINAIAQGRQPLVTVLTEFARSRMAPFLSTTLWVVMVSWFGHNLIHDGWTLAKRRQIMRDAEAKFNVIIDRSRAYGWIRENQAETKEIIARLDNEAAGVGPVVDVAFLYGPRDAPLIAPSSVEEITGPPAQSPQSPTRPDRLGGR
jgi:hypothetical protein